jgi:hypothetical protein
VVAISVIAIFTVGLPVAFVLQLVKRRHRLDESKVVVRRSYQGWRKKQRHKAAARALALLRGHVAEPVVDVEEESMINKDILAVYQIYYSYVREWDQLLFLHRDFTLDRFYWELVEVIRKLLLVLVPSSLTLLFILLYGLAMRPQQACCGRALVAFVAANVCCS